LSLTVDGIFATPNLKDLEKKQGVSPALLFCIAVCKTSGNNRILVLFLPINGKDFTISPLGTMPAI